MDILHTITETLYLESTRKTLSILAILTLSILSRGIVSRVILNTLERAIKRTKTTVDDEILDALRGPMRVLSIIVGVYLIADLYMPVSEVYLIRTLTAGVVFWAMYNVTIPLEAYIKTLHLRLHMSLVKWFLRVIRVLIVVIGTSAILEIWGIKVGAVLAGFGILGAAVALATQDLFKNLIAGFLILSENRFGEGEWIRVDTTCEGTVEHIGLRSTCIRRFDQAPMYIPNAKLADTPLINFTRMKHRRIYWNIGLEYRTTTEQLQRIVTGIDTLVQGENFVDKKHVSTFVVVDTFNDSSIDIMVYAFTKTTDWGAWLDIKEKLALDIKELVEYHGASFAFPSQSIYIEKSETSIPPITGT